MNQLILTRPDQPERRAILTSVRVLHLIMEMHDAGRAASRQTIADLLEVSVARVDEHIKRLLEGGSIRRIMPGVFEPVDMTPPARAVSVTRMHGGLVKIEVGDDILTLTLEEERLLAMSVKGAAEQFHAMVSGRDLADQVAELRRQGAESMARSVSDKNRIAELEEQVCALRSIPRQMGLDASS
jgi:DNA-binding Lrp family transcriptional regulator